LFGHFVEEREGEDKSNEETGR